jgi:predicted RND superfamily exporter protein
VEYSCVVARRPEELARAYVAWVRRRVVPILIAHLLVTVGAVYLIAHQLPLYADFSYLLPQDGPAVRDLRRLEARLNAGDSVLVVLEAPTPDARAAAMTELAAGVAAIPTDLVSRVDGDDVELRAFVKAHRHLFIPLADLERASAALAERTKAAKLKANPLYIDLDSDPGGAHDRAQLDDLRARRRDAEAKLDRPLNVSSDGKTATLQLLTAFRATDVDRGVALIGALDEIRTRVTAAHPGVAIGWAGPVVNSVAEHDGIFRGMILSSAITTLLVALVLALYFRSATLLCLLIGTLAIASVVAFGLAALTVGHLNAATAFLGAIIAGNGVNYGILLIARLLEERRRCDTFDDALAAAIMGTLRPTLIASLGAAIAYGSLVATSFRGFADFAIIGALGMLVCWIATYLLLSALLLAWGTNTRIYAGDPLVGGMLVRAIGFRRSRVVCAAAVAVGVVSAIVCVRYFAADPFEYDIKNLRSEGRAAVTARHWMSVSDHNFGRGVAGRMFIAADRLEQVPRIVAALRAREASVPEPWRTIGSIESILDIVPEDQPAKLRILAAIRKQLDDAADALEPRELDELRPPDELGAITIESLPAPLVERLRERDGRVGYLISIRPTDRLDEWDGRDLIRFATAVRRLDLGGGEIVTTSGGNVIFMDIVESLERDAPRVTALAAIGIAVMVVLLVGRNRRAVAVLLGTGAGSLLMVALCATLGVRANFLNFVALPITLGIGIDYAINVAHRHDHDAVPDPIETLRTSGAAVFICSLTTIIGYASLLVSDNLAIRGFGTASLIGELSCVFTALVLVPAFLALGSNKREVA